MSASSTDDAIMNLTLPLEPGLFLTDSSPGMRAYPVTAFVPHDPRPPQSNQSLLSANQSADLSVSFDPVGRPIWQVLLIAILCGSLSLLTIIGNILVLLSFKLNRQLKTVSNYYLLSLAFADLIIGVLSMNLYTTYIIMGHWALGPWACDLWLAIDYVASNASVMNLLVISFDRYFSITRPLTYRAKRTTKRALTLICLAWSISFILWAPAILFWQYFVGERTVAPHECYIQFISEPITTFCTAIAAFYLPVSIMSVLYWRIYRETEQRSRELAGLKASGNQGDPEESVNPQTGSSRSHGSYEIQPDAGKNTHRFRFWSRKSGGDPDHSSYEIRTNAGKTAAGEKSSGKTAGHFRFWSRNSGGDPDHSSYEIRKDARKSAAGCFRFWSRKRGGNPDPSSCEIQANAGKTVAGERSSGKTVGRFRFWNRNTGNPVPSSYEFQEAAGKTATRRFRFWNSAGDPDSSDSWNNNKMAVSVEHSEDEGEEAPHVYLIVLERQDDSEKFQPADAEPRPSRKGDSKPSRLEALGNPEESVIPKTGSSRIHSSYKIQSAGQRSAGKTVRCFRFWSRNSGGDPDRSCNDSWNNNETAVSIDQSEDEGEEAPHITSVGPENRNAEPRASGKGVSQPPSPDAKEPVTQKKTEVSKRKKPSLVKEKKAAQTLSAILLAFILTWTPYNIMVLVNAFCRPDCIPEALWALGYWLCYVNSTVNPMCYALCNKAFRTTFRAILLCEWSQIQPRPAHAQRHR